LAAAVPDISLVLRFLPCGTPLGWLEKATADIPTLLVDHAGLELKAAQQALTLMNRYAGRAELLKKMSRLAREELRHFERVMAILRRREIPYRPLSASRYTAGLHRAIRKAEPEKLTDTLVVGAIIEARSCERFHCLLPYLTEHDEELAAFYSSLLQSEARHFTDYLDLAERSSSASTSKRVAELLAIEADLICGDDKKLRFHSGIPS
jgi:tRNA-(ms[2]io[6]A)-hydroxylase